MVIIKTPSEISLMRDCNAIVAETLRGVREHVRAGVETLELDRYAENFVKKKGAKPAFKGYRGYPYALCVSVNEEVVHGFPSERILCEGDIVSVDFGVLYKGFYGDSAITIPVGEVSEAAKRLVRITEEALFHGIENACAGNRLGDISAAVQEHVESAGFSVVRDFVGHGIGRELHEDPPIPNYGRRGRGIELKPGMVLAIEPMVNEGTNQIEIKADNWTAVTADSRLSAHFEHTVAITKNGPAILSQ